MAIYESIAVTWIAASVHLDLWLWRRLTPRATHSSTRSTPANRLLASSSSAHTRFIILQCVQSTSSSELALHTSDFDSEMARTPPKTAQWNLDFSDSLGSPFIDAPSTDSVTSTSTLQYVNSQLIAHGFAHSPGLSLDGLSNGDSEKVVKCLFGMLSQRMVRASYSS